MIDFVQLAALLTGIGSPQVQYGMATWYDPAGGPLYATPYTPVNQLMWCAVNVSRYRDGTVKAGDMLLVHFIVQDQYRIFEAWDAGPFDGYYVEDHPDLPILVDIPQHLWPVYGRSAEVEVINLSAEMRR